MPQPPSGLYIGGSMTGYVEKYSGLLVAYDGESWVENFDSDVLLRYNSYPTAIVDWNGDLIISGDGLRTPNPNLQRIWGNLVRWIPSNRTWEPVGGGTDRRVRSLLVWNGTLVVRGAFTAVNVNGDAGPSQNFPAPGIAMFDGTNWARFDPGLDNDVESMIEFRGDLVVGGNFRFTADYATSVERIARWDGTQWSSMGGLDSSPKQMAVYNGDLYVFSGSLSMAGGTPVNRIARFDGTSWFSVGDGLSSGVEFLIPFEGLLYTFGLGLQTGSTSLGRIATWNGTDWQSVPVPPLFATSWSSHSVINGSIFLTGTSQAVGATRMNYVVRFQGGQFFPVAGGVLGELNSFSRSGVWNNKLLVSERVFGTNPAPSDKFVIMREDNTIQDTGLWAPYMPYSSSVNAILHLNDTVFLGGSIQRTSVGDCGGILRWNGRTHETLPNEFGVGLNDNANVMSMIHLGDGVVGIGGVIPVIAGQPAMHFALWNGSMILPVDGFNSGVLSMTVIRGTVYATGWFTLAGINASYPTPAPPPFVDPLTANRVARWTGSGWEAVPGWGFDQSVDALIEFNGDILAFGSFNYAALDGWVDDYSGIYPPSAVFAPLVARWNGSVWSAVDLTNGPTGSPSYVIEFNGRLFGCFWPRMMSWDGFTWRTEVVTMASPYVTESYSCNTFAMWRNELYAGGAALSRALLLKLNSTTDTWETMGPVFDQSIKTLLAFE